MIRQVKSRLRALIALPLFAAGASVFAACASVPPPTERMASTQSAIRAAQEIGAEQVPEAQLHLKLAEDQVQKARHLIDSGDNQHADLVLQRANADAELGLSLAREQATRDQAQRVLWHTRNLQQRNQ